MEHASKPSSRRIKIQRRNAPRPQESRCLVSPDAAISNQIKLFWSPAWSLFPSLNGAPHELFLKFQLHSFHSLAVDHQSAPIACSSEKNAITSTASAISRFQTRSPFDAHNCQRRHHSNTQSSSSASRARPAATPLHPRSLPFLA